MKAAMILATIGLVATIPATILRGVVISILWTWFVIPLNYSIPYMHIAWGIGFSTLASMILPIYDLGESSGAKIVNGIVLSYLMPIIAIITGAIVRNWM